MNSLILGLHLLSYHTAPGLESVTPGVYLRHESGLTAGIYRNSHGKVSTYAGHTTVVGNWALTLAAVTGYPNKPVRFGVLPSYSVALNDDTRLRFTYGPKVAGWSKTHLLHLSIERGF